MLRMLARVECLCCCWQLVCSTQADVKRHCCECVLSECCASLQDPDVLL